MNRREYMLNAEFVQSLDSTDGHPTPERDSNMTCVYYQRERRAELRWQQPARQTGDCDYRRDEPCGTSRVVPTNNSPHTT